MFHNDLRETEFESEAWLNTSHNLKNKQTNILAVCFKVRTGFLALINYFVGQFVFINKDIWHIQSGGRNINFYPWPNKINSKNQFLVPTSGSVIEPFSPSSRGGSFISALSSGLPSTSPVPSHSYQPHPCIFPNVSKSFFHSLSHFRSLLGNLHSSLHSFNKYLLRTHFGQALF